MKMKVKAITTGLAALLAAVAAHAAPVLWDINTGSGALNATVADFNTAGVTEFLGGATVSHVTGNASAGSPMTDGTITLTLSENVTGPYPNGNSSNPILKEYLSLRDNGPVDVQISGLSSQLVANTTYSFYLWGVGDNANQGSVITFGGGTNTISQSDPDSDDGSGFFVKFSFDTGAVVSNTLDFVWARNGGNKYAGFNGFAIVADTTPDLYTAISPALEATYVTNLPTIEVAVTNGAKNVDTGSFTMALVLDSTTNDVTSGVSITPTGNGAIFSYTPASILENGAEYTVLYSVAGIGGSAGNYISSFTTAPDLHYSTTPVDGALYVATDAEVSVTFTNVAVSLSNLYSSAELMVNSTDVSGDLAISYPSNGVMKFEYAHSGLAFGQTYDVQLNVFRTDGYTNTVELSFDSAVDPSVYLIAPGLRNGGFELVDGATGYGPIMTDWSRIDDWANTGGGAKTESIPSPSEGTRALVTGNASQTYNITENTISDGDIFEFKWTVPGRANGVSVGLAYDDGGVIEIVSNSLVYTSGTIGEFSGSYLFDSVKDPDAIGKPVGIIIIDDNTGGGAVYVDEVRLYYGNIAVQSLSPADGSTGVAKDSSIEVVIGESASQVDTNSLVLTLDGVDVTADSVISDTASGVTMTYTPTNDLVVGRHFASVSASGTPEGTAAQSWSFLVDPTGIYLISPDVRNGSFELVGGVQGSGTTNDWTAIDDWSDNGAGIGAKTENNGIATDGSRIMVTATASETYNMTDTVISEGDRFGYSFVIVGRPFGLSAALAYNDGGSIVVVSNSMTSVFGGSTPQTVSFEYTLTSGSDPEAIGKTIGLILIDDGNAGNNGAVQIDEVRLYSDTTAPTEQPVITEFSISGSTVTVSYTSQNLGLYSLQSKEDLVYADWVTVLSNLPSGNLTTNLPVSDASQEFYQVISQ